MKLEKTIIQLLVLLLFTSCLNDNKEQNAMLVETGDKITFSLDAKTKNELFAYSIYEDKNKNKYFSFQNRSSNTILVYDLKTQDLMFKLELPIDGNNGIGFANGYYIHNWDSIYIPNRDIKEISLISKDLIVSNKYTYETDNANKELSLFDFSTFYYKPAEVIGDKMYIYSGPNRYIANDPVSVEFNINTGDFKALPFNYPEYPGSEISLKKYGLETAFSRCFDGEKFIYSFYYDEYIYVTQPAHKDIQKIPVKSKYFNKVQLPNELMASPIDFCENSWYGNLLYDKYRKVYYRIAYPKTEIEKEKNIRPADLICYGRKNFSIIILDKQFNVIGETKFPDYIYNSGVMMILEDGLYISDSHYLNPEFNDDVLSFRLFKLTK